MDFTDAFVNSLQPLYFASFDELKRRMKEFEESSGLQYSIKRSVRLNDVPQRDQFVYKYIQYVCAYQRCGHCQSFINVCHSYGTLRVCKYWMVHSHLDNDELVEGPSSSSEPVLPPLPPLLQVPDHVSDDGDILTDLTSIFKELVPLRHFSSFSDLEKMLTNFQQATGCLLVKRNSIRFPPESPEHDTLVYKSLTYACCHYGNGRVRSIKLQPPKTRKMNCPCEIRIGCRAKKLHIIAFVMRHNHPVAAELAENYPENRRLTEKEKDEINDILKSSPSNLVVKEHIERRFGKHCSLNDVRQMKYRFRKSQKLRSSKDFASVKIECDMPDEDDMNPAYELSTETISSWSEQAKENRLSEFIPYSQKLGELVCSSDNETFYERLDFIKELIETWQTGKQPVLLTL